MPRSFGQEHLPALGARVRGLREARRWSLKRLAQESGVSPAALHKIERGEANPSILTILALVEALGEPIDRLIEAARAERSAVHVTRAVSPRRTMIAAHGTSADLQDLTGELADPRMRAVSADLSGGARLDLAALGLGEALFCFVLAGHVVAAEGEKGPIDLFESDALHATKAPPKRLSNPQRQAARVLCVGQGSADAAPDTTRPSGYGAASRSGATG